MKAATASLLDPFVDFQSFIAGEDLLHGHKVAQARPTDVGTISLPLVTFPTGSSTIPLFEIKSASWRYVLRQPMSVTVSQEGDLFVAEHPRLEITAYGADQREALHNFRREFDVIYYEIALADPATLMPRAQRLREVLRALVVAGP